MSEVVDLARVRSVTRLRYELAIAAGRVLGAVLALRWDRLDLYEACEAGIVRVKVTSGDAMVTLQTFRPTRMHILAESTDIGGPTGNEVDSVPADSLEVGIGLVMLTQLAVLRKSAMEPRRSALGDELRRIIRRGKVAVGG